MRTASSLLMFLLFAACPAVNSKPCAEDSACAADQRCRRGACGPICLADSECGSGQVCKAGVCAVRPECVQETDCAVGFSCSSQGLCQCNGDASCAANQQCLEGRCATRPRCTADADCLSTGGRCELTQGLCLPRCTLPADCAPTLDPRLAFALYTCVQGTCTRRCTTDAVCGGAGFICRDGLCAVAECRTATDCAADQYCTSATFGRCQTFELCTPSSQCAHNFECRRFESTQCPPGFDCSKQICQELPRCLADGDCVTGASATPSGFCEEGHCQATSPCTAPAQCAQGRTCIAGLCVPAICRGHATCDAGRACVDGACVAPPPPESVTQLKLRPTRALLLVGETLQLKLVEYPLDGTSFPAATASWALLDAQGAPSTAASITPEGLLTAVSAGELRVRATLPGAAVAPVEAQLTIYPPVTTGRRVIVVDPATQTPLQNARVLGCLSSDCTRPLEVTTDALGVALFPTLTTDAAVFTAASATLRSDGLPSFERASIIGTTSRDVLIPLRDNPVKAAGGFSASLAFTDVSTVGNYWAGFVTASVSDLPSLTPQGLLGESFLTELPGVPQAVPVPSTVILYTSPAFGIPQPIKPRSLGVAQSGERFMSAWAGRASLDLATSLRSTDVLSYLGAFDYAQDTNGRFASRPFVPDTADLNGNGLCSNAQECPMGTEDVPDYANFAKLTWQPRRQQRLRTEVVMPRVPLAFDTIITALVQVDPTAGMLPTGFSSATAGAPAQDGTRKVDPISLRAGAPYNGLETATPGLWALATNAAGTQLSGRLVTFPAVPLSVSVLPLLPAPTLSSFNPVLRVFNPGQPAWASAFSSGADLARVSVTGTEVRHVAYFAIQGSQTRVDWPSAPQVPGLDPASQAGSGLEVVTVDLAGHTSVEAVFDFGGSSLMNWLTTTSGYSRVDR